ncbi:uncharacterized protein LOC114747261 [Neltuma alba]|uniref:uncharacterized protein LOC114747261 n=1 Tax=Neltuma alba TaxID=207710 RepID=UPI0010A3F61F|nr:uncharacterized protein LOC114747261 [Prosopis alba]
MASDETATFHSSLPDEDFDYDVDDGYDPYQHPHPHNMSRLSVCTSSTLCAADDDDEADNAMAVYVSRLSIESFEEGDGDADGELSDCKQPLTVGLSSDSENESSGCYSLPATPPRRRNRVGVTDKSPIAAKDYASDDEARKGRLMGENRKKPDPWRRRRRTRKNRWMSMERGDNRKREDEQVSHGWSGDSDGVRVITRPKGGKRSLCMDLEEMKACRDLGFELEQERTLEMPSRFSLSNSTLDTSSGSNSPIASWRISTPGDDPRDVKARLKVWAQAVAMASASKYGA